MKRWGLVVAGVGVLLAAGWGTYRAVGPSRTATAVQATTTNPLQTPSGRRYRQCQPHHWRYIVLQH